MFAYEYLIYTPAFYFLVAFTLILTFGYTWGRRFNRRVLTSALDPLIEIFHARDQEFTNIGGQTGFHARIVPGRSRVVREVDATVTLLPRQSLLYLPFSLLTRRSDRLQMILQFNKRGRSLQQEAHLIEPGFGKRMGNRIENADSLEQDTVQWGGRGFRLYAGGPDARAWVQQLMQQLPEPGGIRHVAIVPAQQQAYLFLVPRVGEVSRVVPSVRDWLDSLVEPADQEANDGAVEA